MSVGRQCLNRAVVSQRYLFGIHSFGPVSQSIRLVGESHGKVCLLREAFIALGHTARRIEVSICTERLLFCVGYSK